MGEIRYVYENPDSVTIYAGETKIAWGQFSKLNKFWRVIIVKTSELFNVLKIEDVSDAITDYYFEPVDSVE